MQLSRESKLVKWTYWTPWMESWGDHQRCLVAGSGYRPIRNAAGEVINYDYIPPTYERRVSLCLFFWQAFLFATLSNIVGAVVCAVAYPVMWMAAGGRWLWTRLTNYMDQRLTFEQRQAKAEKWRQRSKRVDAWIERKVRAVKGSVFVQGLKTLKGTMCPLIRIMNER